MNIPYYKQEEIQEYIDDSIKENIKYNEDYLDKDRSDIHNQLFNEDYYMIGYYNCRKWMGDKAFEIIGIIKEYEKEKITPNGHGRTL